MINLEDLKKKCVKNNDTKTKCYYTYTKMNYLFVIPGNKLDILII